MIPAGVGPERLEAIVKEAGSIVLSYFNKQLSCRYKEQNGFVTEADLASEEFLMRELRALLPQAAFWAEESGKSGEGDYCWVIDPLDGTTNFAHHIPYFCISVALTYRHKPIVGIIYQPLLNEFFYAEQGKGAFLNGVKIRVNPEQDLAKSMVVVGFRYAKNKHFMGLVERVRHIMPKTYSFRYFGAVALDLAYVAAGRLDGAFFEGLEWWDVAAGMLLIQEAGGWVTDFQGQEITPTYLSLVAANRQMHEKLLPLLQ